MIDIVTHKILPVHFIWFNSANLNNTRLSESLRYGMLEVQEHLETFCDRKDQATMVNYKKYVLYVTNNFFLVFRFNKNIFKIRNVKWTAF